MNSSVKEKIFPFSEKYQFHRVILEFLIEEENRFLSREKKCYSKYTSDDYISEWEDLMNSNRICIETNLQDRVLIELALLVFKDIWECSVGKFEEILDENIFSYTNNGRTEIEMKDNLQKYIDLVDLEDVDFSETEFTKRDKKIRDDLLDFYVPNEIRKYTLQELLVWTNKLLISSE